MPKNSAAKRIYGGFSVSNIWRLIRRALIFPADFRRTNFRLQFRRSAAVEGYYEQQSWQRTFYWSQNNATDK